MPDVTGSIGGRGKLEHYESLDQLASKLEESLGFPGLLADLSQEFRVDLTPGAALMLLIPLIEAEAQAAGKALPIRKSGQIWSGSGYFGRYLKRYQKRASYQKPTKNPEAEASLRKLLQTIAQPPSSPRLKNHGVPAYDGRVADRTRSSLSVIKAFWKNFCNIPPFCGQA